MLVALCVVLGNVCKFHIFTKSLKKKLVYGLKSNLMC